MLNSFSVQRPYYSPYPLTHCVVQLPSSSQGSAAAAGATFRDYQVKLSPPSADAPQASKGAFVHGGGRSPLDAPSQTGMTLFSLSFN